MTDIIKSPPEAGGATVIPFPGRGKQGISTEEQVRLLLPGVCLHVAAETLSELGERWNCGVYSERDAGELDSALNMMGFAERLAGD